MDPQPILIEVTRGNVVESIHRGSIAIADADGNVRFACGSIGALVYPRSSLKPIQALPLIETGAADAFALGPEEIALACASHSGEFMHTSRVENWLARIECSQSDLVCGAEPPRYQPAFEAMMRKGQRPTRVHHNCSGKHAGFLTVARHCGFPTRNYDDVDHPVQKLVAKTLSELSGIAEPLAHGVDGCGVPNFALPLTALARAFAKLATWEDSTLPHADAAKRIFQAMTSHPELVSGTVRASAILMGACGGRVALKEGAEGFHAAIVPRAKLGVVLEIDDGAGRAAETTMAAILDKLGLILNRSAVEKILSAPVKNSNGREVGRRRPSPILSGIDLSGEHPT